jgi:purine-binding chemotaxis protein CheW
MSAPGASTTSRFLLVRVRATVVALPLEDTVEVMRPLPVEAVGGMPAFVRGLSIIRGAPVPVVDLGAVLAPGPARAAGRLVTIRAGERRVALAVDEILGVRSLDASALGAVPELLGESGLDPIAAIGAADRKLLLVLAASRIVPEALWPTLDLAAGTS